MDAELLTRLLRATNDGVVPAPHPGESTGSYGFRAACAGAVVADQWRQDQMDDNDKATGPQADQAGAHRNDHGFNGQGLTAAPATKGRPSDVTETSPDGTGASPAKTAAEIDQILRRPDLSSDGGHVPPLRGALNGAGTPVYAQDHAGEIGVD